MRTKNLLKIKAGFSVPPDDQPGFDHYLHSIELLLEKIIPSEILNPKKPQNPEKCFFALNKLLPIIYSSSNDSAPCAISLAILCSAEYTHGVGRFLCDMCSRWLIPGKQVPIVTVRSLNFEFAASPGFHYFMTELCADIFEERDLILIKKNIPGFIEETRLNVLAVQHARHVVTIKPLSFNEKKIIIQENFASLVNRPSKEFENNIFDQMHHLLIKASAEEKVTQIKEQITPLLKYRPKVFDRDIFNELHHFIFLFKDQFTAIRDTIHLTRIISYQHLFRKSLQNAMVETPTKRHISIKLFKTSIQGSENKRKVLSILITLNRLRENEIFEKRHVLKAIQSYLPQVQNIEGSYIIDRRENDRIRTLYLEIEKIDESPFSSQEIKELRKRLPRELQSRIETVIHPIFMYRNEEETMRNILILSKQLKYVHDIPQVIVTFHKQIDEQVVFTVILLRLVKPNSVGVKEVFQNASTFLKMGDLDVKIVGLLRKKYPKEANVFEMTLDKRPFLRKDYSLDLYKARQAVFIEMTRLIGEIRDYNGGMISKQNEVFSELKKLLLEANVHNDFLLENFFYSLTPSYMQSLLSPHILKETFILLTQAIDHDYNQDIYSSKMSIFQDHLILVIGAGDDSFKDNILQMLEQHNTPSSEDLATSYVLIYDISCMSFIMRFEDAEEYQFFCQNIKHIMEKWKDERQCEIKKQNDASPFLISVSN